MRWSMVVVAVLLSARLAAEETQEVTPTLRVQMTAKPAVVRILDGFDGYVEFGQGKQLNVSAISTGSGFFVSADGYIMTNAHVVSGIKGGQQGAEQTLMMQFLGKVLTGQQMAMTPENIKKAATWADAQGARVFIKHRYNQVLLEGGVSLPYEIKSFGTPIGSQGDQLIGKDVAILKVEMKNAPTLQLADSSKVKVGDRVYVMGFPGAADSAVLNENSLVEVTINDGTVSAVKTTKDGIPVLQTNTSATHGNSGGPVLNQNAEVIGMLTFRGDAVNGQEVQGFNFIVPSNTAREFLVQAGADNRQGLLDQRWREGLSDFWKQRFKTSKEHFEEVVALWPQHAEAKKLISESQERILEGADKTSILPDGVMLGLASGTGTLVVGGLVLLLMRKRPAAARARPTTVAKSDALSISFLSGPLAGRQQTVKPGGAYIGRDKARVDIVVPDDLVSGQHLWIGLRQGRWVVRDNRSTNGTYLNSVHSGRIDEQGLSNGDVVILGNGATVRFSVKF